MSVGANLGSRATLRSSCDLADLGGWLALEVVGEPAGPIRDVLTIVARSLPAFTRWADHARLLLPGRTRAQRSPRYPAEIVAEARARQIPLDTRSNGPAIAAFLLAGGERPERSGSLNAWTVHHVYSGKFSYTGRTTTLRAVSDGSHFTNSAGLVAIHPIADQICDEFPCFAWALRAEAFHRFGYDPDGVFTKSAPASRSSPSDARAPALVLRGVD